VWDGVSVWHSGWRKDKGETAFQRPPGIAVLSHKSKGHKMAKFM